MRETYATGCMDVWLSHWQVDVCVWRDCFWFRARRMTQSLTSWCLCLAWLFLIQSKTYDSVTDKLMFVFGVIVSDSEQDVWLSHWQVDVCVWRDCFWFRARRMTQSLTSRCLCLAWLFLIQSKTYDSVTDKSMFVFSVIVSDSEQDVWLSHWQVHGLLLRKGNY